MLAHVYILPPFPTFHRGGPGSRPGQVMWDLWCTERRRGMFSASTSVSPVNHSFHGFLHDHHSLPSRAGTTGE
jgi:hypothetical protein